MTNPIGLLRRVGIESPELERYWSNDDRTESLNLAEDAILDVVEIAARYKWQFDYLVKNVADGYWTEDGWHHAADAFEVIADLDYRYDHARCEGHW